MIGDGIRYLEVLGNITTGALGVYDLYVRSTPCIVVQ